MSNEQEKKKVAEAALDYVESSDVIGLGTGSTTNFFIENLIKLKNKLDGVVVSSKSTAKRISAIGIPIFELNAIGHLPLYVDGAPLPPPCINS